MASRLLVVLILILTGASAFGQGYFQRNRAAFQKARFNQTTKRYGRACDIFEKKRVKGEKRPILSLGLGRKRKPKMAEQN